MTSKPMHRDSGECPSQTRSFTLSSPSVLGCLGPLHWLSEREYPLRFEPIIDSKVRLMGFTWQEGPSFSFQWYGGFYAGWQTLATTRSLFGSLLSPSHTWPQFLEACINEFQ
ncbi:uncharacterized protein PV07_08496 [Cladophialophora immunda]|uniref:Uncharacterized protein n=1 Tax=Cladophialophora immunda TaxID=569365 RepID=A0A0D2CP30_9EURO|nr:uncharacterized protein PV07_08496 [Cladophialophora immunda]KIW25309.1 hypothetical protein PV07_08496 [Cladophialophora immunda]